MRDEPLNAYADVDREAMRDRDPRDMDPDDRPTREDVADLEPRPPFVNPPGTERRGGWALVKPQYRRGT